MQQLHTSGILISHMHAARVRGCPWIRGGRKQSRLLAVGQGGQPLGRKQRQLLPLLALVLLLHKTQR